LHVSARSHEVCAALPHAAPDASNRHAGEQQSPASVSWSSHCSPEFRMPLPQRLQPETIAAHVSALQHSCPAIAGSHASPGSTVPLPQRLQVTERPTVSGIELPAVLLCAVTVTAKSVALTASLDRNVQRLTGPGAACGEFAIQPCLRIFGEDAS